MKRFEIWAEGYAATGENGTANLFGTASGATFKDACDSFFRNREDAHYYDPQDLTYWGCRLFDNEAKARESFG